MMNWSIRRRVMFLALAPTALIGIALYLYFISTQVALLEDTRHERAVALLSHLAAASEYGVVTGNRAMLTNLIQKVGRDQDIVGIEVRDASHRRMSRWGRLSGDRLRAAPRPQGAGLCLQAVARELFCAPIVRTRLSVSDYSELPAGPPKQRPASDVVGWVYMEISTAAAHARQTQAMVQSGLITGAVILIAALLATRVGRQITRPVTALTRTVRAVAAGDFGARSAVDSGAELRTLQEGINTMVQALAESDREMRRRIDEATTRLRQTLYELEEKNRDLERQRLRAERASSAKSEFLAVMSHEIRTPLSGMIGMLELLRRSRLDRDQLTYLQNIESAATALGSLIDDILDVSRMEAGKLQVVEEAIRPRELIKDVALLMAPSAQAKGLEFVCDIAPDFPARAMGDPLRLRQILINLISNAVKFTDRGQIRLSAGRVGSGDGSVRFAIEDTGIGIPPEKLPTIFDSFTQLDSSATRRHGGSGLGTTIAKSLVELMGGRIGVEPRNGGGTRFWFELTWRHMAAGEPPAPALVDRRVLVVDPNPDAARALVHACEWLGLRATAARPDQLEQLDPRVRYDCAILADGAPSPGHAAGAALARAAPCLIRVGTGPEPAEAADARLSKPVFADALSESLRVLLTGEPERTEQVPESRRPARALRVLVAEDEPINAKVITTFLEQQGHRPVLAEDGHAAWRHMTGDSFDLVLMDIRMPGRDGLELTRHWRAREGQGPRLPIVGLTANASAQDRQAGLAAGMDEFLFKPVDRDRLFELIEGLCPPSRACAADGGA